jgi:tRNA dimethylallyltransferase
VGGTGLYIRALVKDLSEIFIPRNVKLRIKLNKLETAELQKILRQISFNKFYSMNESDQNNPRRLIRAIEIQKWKQKQRSGAVILERNEMRTPESGFWTGQNDKLIIGLTTSREILYKKIEQRVNQRVESGMIQEIQSLLTKGYVWSLPAFSALGYDVWKEYIDKMPILSKNEQVNLKNKIVHRWTIEEQLYAKRQMTWFKKEPNVIWFDIKQSNLDKNILKQVQKWYN